MVLNQRFIFKCADSRACIFMSATCVLTSVLCPPASATHRHRAADHGRAFPLSTHVFTTSWEAQLGSLSSSALFFQDCPIKGITQAHQVSLSGVHLSFIRVVKRIPCLPNERCSHLFVCSIYDLYFSSLFKNIYFLFYFLSL